MPITPNERPHDAASVDAATHMLVEAQAARAGLDLTPAQLEPLCASAPYVLAMAERMRRKRDWADEPANVFRMSDY
jgi:hypothetical protein